MFLEEVRKKRRRRLILTSSISAACVAAAFALFPAQAMQLPIRIKDVIAQSWQEAVAPGSGGYAADIAARTNIYRETTAETTAETTTVAPAKSVAKVVTLPPGPAPAPHLITSTIPNPPPASTSKLALPVEPPMPSSSVMVVPVIVMTTTTATTIATTSATSTIEVQLDADPSSAPSSTPSESPPELPEPSAPAPEPPMQLPAQPTSTSAPTAGLAAPAHVVIAGVQIAGASSANDFIKIFNPTPMPVDVSGWKLRKRSSSGTEYSIKVFPSESLVAPGAYFTWANSAGGFGDSIGANITSSATLAANNSAALMDASGVVIDAVAWGEGAGQFFEGAPVAANPTAGQVLQRKIESGVIVDTDNNANDFTNM